MGESVSISPQDLQRIFAEYDLGDYIQSSTLRGGTVQSNIRVQTTKGEFVLRLYGNRTAASVAFETDLLSHLKERHYPCAAPYKNKHGGFIGIHEQRPCVVFEFLQGHPVEEPDEGQRRQLIQKAAELHIITSGYVPLNVTHRLNYSVPQCRGLAIQASKRIGTADAGLKLRWLEAELSTLVLPEALPMGVCHADFHFSNVLFKDGEFTALLDFDDANYTYLLYDLVGLMEYQAWRFDQDDVLNLHEARQVVTLYNQWRPLSRVEEEHLFDVYKLSVLIDCVWYFDRGGPADFYEKRKIQYLNGLGRDGLRQALFG